jgi:hypothetical protein
MKNNATIIKYYMILPKKYLPFLSAKVSQQMGQEVSKGGHPLR